MNLRGHAVPVDVPPGFQMSEEASPGRLRPALPDELVVRSQAVHHIAPIPAGGFCRADKIAEPAHEVRETGSEGYLGSIDGERPGPGVHGRKQAPPRHCVDWTDMASQQKRQALVDHGET